jgi:hypothetical protein
VDLENVALELAGAPGRWALHFLLFFQIFVQVLNQFFVQLGLQLLLRF